MIKTKITSLFLFTLFCSLSSFSQNSDKTVHDSTFNALNKVKIEQLDNALENSLKLCESEEDTSKIVDQASKRWELEMNKNYQKVLNGGHEEFSSPDVIKELKKTQEAWLKFKAQELALITHYIYVKDNKNQAILLSTRKLEINKIRALQLLLISNRSSKYAIEELNKRFKEKETFKWCKDYSNYGMRKCATKTAEHYDKRLNSAYQDIRNQVDEKGMESIKSTQHAWINYQNAESAIWGKIQELNEGSMYPTLSMQRGMAVIRQRAIELESYMNLLEQNNGAVLPTPDSLFYANGDGSIDQYIKTYFKLIKARAGSREAIDNPEYPDGGFCEFRTEYDRVVIKEEYGCDSYDFIQTYEFRNYSLKEVTRILKILLPKIATEIEDDGWHPEGFYTEDVCTLSILKKGNKIIVEYGCGC
jgi:uncharacterized protein YecT (DUF1311 family)